MASRKGARLALNLFRSFTSHPAPTRASLSRLFAGKPGPGSSILVGNASRVPVFSSPNLLRYSTPKPAPTGASVLPQVTGISRIRSSILAGDTAKIPVSSAMIHHRLGVYSTNRFLGCGVTRFYHADQHQVRRFQPPRRPTRWFKYLTAMALVGSGVMMPLCFGLETIPYSKRKHVAIMSRAMEGELGELRFEMSKEKELKDKILPPDHPYTIRVQSIFQNIIQALERDSMNEDNRKTGHGSSASHLEGLNWEILVVDSVDSPGEFFAYCELAGKIVVFTELLNNFKSDEEIATTIAHEVGHAIARHYSEGLTNDMWLLLAGMIICTYFGMTYGLYIGMMSPFVYAIPAHLVSRASSRKLEMEANYIGLLLMSSAGYDPQAAIRFTERVVELYGDCPSWYEIFWTHPSFKKSAQALAQADVMEEALARYREARELLVRNLRYGEEQRTRETASRRVIAFLKAFIRPHQ